MLIFAVNDLPHVSHADEVVRTCKEVFGKGDDFVMKITGSPTVDRPLQKIRQFRNRPSPNSRHRGHADHRRGYPRHRNDRFHADGEVPHPLGADAWARNPAVQGDQQEKFTIFDCFDGSLIEYFRNATDFDVTLQKETVSLAEIIERIYDNRDREYNVNRLIKRLRRVQNTMGAEAREAFARYIPDGDMKAYADGLKENLQNDFPGTMELLRNKEFQDLLENYPRPKKVFFKGYDIVDTVDDEVMFRVGDDYQKPQDYLRLFEEFVRKNPEQIEAIEVLLSRPSGWNADVLDDLRDKLRKSHFSEKDLQRGHELVYKKPLADIISMVKHASDYHVPILTARERVEKTVALLAEKHTLPKSRKTGSPIFRSTSSKTSPYRRRTSKPCRSSNGTAASPGRSGSSERPSTPY